MKIGRREFLRVSGLTAVAAAAAACAGPTPQVIEKEKVVKETVVVEKQVTVEKVVQATVVVEKQVTVEKVVTATPAPPTIAEAPMLQELVATGKLPPLDERLPVNPCIEVGREGFIGQYGGVIRAPYQGWGNRWHLIRWTSAVPLLQWDDKMVLRPKIAESLESSPDAKVWTIYLRKGMRWSNGDPVSADDYKWMWEYSAKRDDVIYNWGGGKLNQWSQVIEGERVWADVEFLDDYTIRITYQEPNYGGFRNLQENRPAPSNYLKQFHMDTTSDKAALDKQWQEKGLKNWQELLMDREFYALNHECPQLTAWAADRNDFPAEIYVQTRNPYYWVIDPESNQLPYVDQYQWRLYEKWDTVKLWLLGGEIDMWPEIGIPDYQTYKENEAKGGYRLIKNSQAQHRGLQINHTSKDQRLREFIGKKEVRWAISHALNRVEMNEMLYLGLAVPRQYSPIRASPLYDPKYTNAKIEYDPELSNKLLDEAGYAEKNAQGQRLWPGTQEPVSFICECHNDPDDAAVMIQGYLAAVGITMNIKPVSRVLFDEHTKSNDVDAGMWGGDRCFMPIVAPWIWLGTVIDRVWAVAWGKWKNDPTHSDPHCEEPPEGHFIRQIWDIWDNEVLMTADADKQNERFRKILDIWAEEIPMFCCIGDWAMFTLVPNGFRNVKEGTVLDWGVPWISVLPTETFSYEDPETQSRAKRI